MGLGREKAKRKKRKGEIKGAEETVKEKNWKGKEEDREEV